MSEWIEQTVSIKEIHKLITEYDVEVTSEDGWVPIVDYVEKGDWEEYVLKTEDGKNVVRCNENHLFETDIGWKPANELLNSSFNVVTNEGIKSATIIKTDQVIPIVDIIIGHKNHRYYSEGVSSHNTNVGKTMLMCNFAAGNLLDDRNVLYITLEMSREEIGRRIDANLLDISMNELDEQLDFQKYEKRIKKIKHITKNKLIIHEYPTASANVNHFRHLMHELKLKKNFVPDIIYIDYLNICASVRYKKMTNSYDYVKGIAEELRGLAVEYNVPIISATQANRAGTNTSDMDITNISESFGTGMTVDLLIGLVSIPELDEKNQLLVKVLKSRYGDKRKQGMFVITVDYDKMKLYDIDENTYNYTAPQENIIQPSNFDKKKVFADFK